MRDTWDDQRLMAATSPHAVAAFEHEILVRFVNELATEALRTRDVVKRYQGALERMRDSNEAQARTIRALLGEMEDV